MVSLHQVHLQNQVHLGSDEAQHAAFGARSREMVQLRGMPLQVSTVVQLEDSRETETFVDGRGEVPLRVLPIQGEPQVHFAAARAGQARDRGEVRVQQVSVQDKSEKAVEQARQSALGPGRDPLVRVRQVRTQDQETEQFEVAPNHQTHGREGYKVARV
jgi:hypothetical protein